MSNLIPMKFSIKSAKLSTYLGFVFSEYGMKANKKHIEAIQVVSEPSEPNDKKTLQKFLGVITYLHKFIPNTYVKYYSTSPWIIEKRYKKNNTLM